jgi:hypothetical protein
MPVNVTHFVLVLGNDVRAENFLKPSRAFFVLPSFRGGFSKCGYTMCRNVAFEVMVVPPNGPQIFYVITFHNNKIATFHFGEREAHGINGKIGMGCFNRASKIGGDMGHTQLKTGVQGGHVEHRGETEVKVVQKQKSGGEEGTQKKPKNPVKKKNSWYLDL